MSGATLADVFTHTDAGSVAALVAWWAGDRPDGTAVHDDLAAALGAAAAGDPSIIETLETEVREPAGDMVAAALAAAGPAGHAALRRLVDHPDAWVATHAARALADLVEGEAVDDLAAGVLAAIDRHASDPAANETALEMLLGVLRRLRGGAVAA